MAETLTYSYEQQENVDVRVARIFNTFGPRMNANDGRVVSNFIMQALRGKPLTIYGQGHQTRSFQYVHDLVDGLIALMEHNYTRPVNLGNPDEYTIADFAETVRALVAPDDGVIVKKEGTEDDPRKRQPDITVAKEHLNWEPTFSVHQGLQETVAYFKHVLADGYEG